MQPDSLRGVYGGISMARYHQIQHVTGVQVAAPIAMVGYAQLQAGIVVPVPAATLAGSGRRLYRYSAAVVPVRDLPCFETELQFAGAF